MTSAAAPAANVVEGGVRAGVAEFVIGGVDQVAVSTLDSVSHRAARMRQRQSADVESAGCESCDLRGATCKAPTQARRAIRESAVWLTAYRATRDRRPAARAPGPGPSSRAEKRG